MLYASLHDLDVAIASAVSKCGKQVQRILVEFSVFEKILITVEVLYKFADQDNLKHPVFKE